MTEDKLYELDRDELQRELEEKTGIKFDDESYDGDYNLYENNTSDGYTIYQFSDRDLNNRIDFENDVFYYEPEATEILSRLEYMDEGDTYFIADLDLLFQDENAVISYLLENYEEEYDEIHEIIKESGE